MQPPWRDRAAAVHGAAPSGSRAISSIEGALCASTQLATAAALATGVPEFERLQTGSVLHGDSVNIRRGVAFVLLPHTDEFRQIFDHVIQSALEQNGLMAL